MQAVVVLCIQRPARVHRRQREDVGELLDELVDERVLPQARHAAEGERLGLGFVDGARRNHVGVVQHVHGVAIDHLVHDGRELCAQLPELRVAGLENVRVRARVQRCDALVKERRGGALVGLELVDARRERPHSLDAPLNHRLHERGAFAEALLERLHARRHDAHRAHVRREHGVGLEVAHALHVHGQDCAPPGERHVSHGAQAGAVPLAVGLGVLQEAPLRVVHQRAERRAADEAVVLALHLALARLARGRRHRPPELVRVALEQHGGHLALAHARRSREREDARRHLPVPLGRREHDRAAGAAAAQRAHQAVEERLVIGRLADRGRPGEARRARREALARARAELHHLLDPPREPAEGADVLSRAAVQGAVHGHHLEDGLGEQHGPQLLVLWRPHEDRAAEQVDRHVVVDHDGAPRAAHVQANGVAPARAGFLRRDELPQVVARPDARRVGPHALDDVDEPVELGDAAARRELAHEVALRGNVGRARARRLAKAGAHAAQLVFVVLAEGVLPGGAEAHHRQAGRQLWGALPHVDLFAHRLGHDHPVAVLVELAFVAIDHARGRACARERGSERWTSKGGEARERVAKRGGKGAGGQDASVNGAGG